MLTPTNPRSVPSSIRHSRNLGTAWRYNHSKRWLVFRKIHSAVSFIPCRGLALSAWSAICNTSRKAQGFPATTRYNHDGACLENMKVTFSEHAQYQTPQGLHRVRCDPTKVKQEFRMPEVAGRAKLSRKQIMDEITVGRGPTSRRMYDTFQRNAIGRWVTKWCRDIYNGMGNVLCEKGGKDSTALHSPHNFQKEQRTLVILMSQTNPFKLQPTISVLPLRGPFGRVARPSLRHG